MLGDLNTRFSDASALAVLSEVSRSELYRDLFPGPVLVPGKSRPNALRGQRPFSWLVRPNTPPAPPPEQCTAAVD